MEVLYIYVHDREQGPSVEFKYTVYRRGGDDSYLLNMYHVSDNGKGLWLFTGTVGTITPLSAGSSLLLFEF
jgi:hypothetical protein